MLLAIVFIHNSVWAQKDLFQSEKLEARKGFLLGANGNFDMPAGDLKNRFGNSYRLGTSMHYKTKKNWIFGVKFDFTNGDQIKEDSLFYGIKDNVGTMLNQNGQRIGVNTYRRGFMTGVEAGYIFNTSKSVSDNGIMVMTGIGFMPVSYTHLDVYKRQQEYPLSEFLFCQKCLK